MFTGESKLFPRQSKVATGGQGAGDQYTGQRPGDIPVWEERFEYDTGREVLAPDGNYYRCLEDHIASNSFAIDLGNGLWSLFAGPALDNDDQVLSLDGDGVTLRLSNGNAGGVPVPDTTVDLTPFLDNTDNQQISLAPGNILTLSNGTGPDTTVDLTPFLDNTDNQQLSLAAGNMLTLSNGTGPDTVVDLTPYLDNTDNQTLSIDGDGVTLRLSNGTGADTTVDLTPFLDNTDAQTLSLVDNDLSISNGNTIDLSKYVHAPSKAGSEAFANFAGTPMKATITFTTPFADANYTPVVTIQSGDNYSATVESVAAGSFVINLNSNIAPTANVLWHAVKHGEF